MMIFRIPAANLFLLLVAGMVSCTPLEPDPTLLDDVSSGEASLDGVSRTELERHNEAGEDMIPDFSRVGYHYGDREIPDCPVGMTLTSTGDRTDRSAEINDALASIPEGTALLLGEGVFYVDRPIMIDRSGVVLRGSGRDRTVIHSTMKAHDDKGNELTNIICLGNPSVGRVLDMDCYARIVSGHTPVGQFFVEVDDASGFNVGDRVVIHRSCTRNWIHDLGMDQIPPQATSIQACWDPTIADAYWERVVMAVEEHSIWLDNPVVMAIDAEYGGGELIKCSWERISECGIEDLTIDSDYDPAVVSTQEGRDNGLYDTHDPEAPWVDEDHPQNCIKCYSAEHCWVRRVTGQHHVFNMVGMGSGSRHITVSDCLSRQPISMIDGSRRYAFMIGQGEAILFKDCETWQDRHNFVTSGNATGPGVFLRCTVHETYSVTGPHNHWATGFLYDNVHIHDDWRNGSGRYLMVQDAWNQGTKSHGWTGVNHVFWNCTAPWLVCQSPWVTGKNWCIGCTGEQRFGSVKGVNMEEGQRPLGEWVSHNVPVTSGTYYGWTVEGPSLYESQLAQRRAAGIYLGNI